MYKIVHKEGSGAPTCFHMIASYALKSGRHGHTIVPTCVIHYHIDATNFGIQLFLASYSKLHLISIILEGCHFASLSDLFSS
jgi:hypothetical protein